MRSVSFKTILENVLGYCNIPYEAASATDLRQATNFINMRVEEGWNWAPWPEWTPCEERAFAAPWLAQWAYAEDDICWLAATGKYYTALQAGTNQNPETATTYWEELTDYTRVIEWNQLGMEKIGRVLGVYDSNIDQQNIYRELPYQETLDGISLLKTTGTTVWLKYMIMAPVYSSNLWSAQGDYDRYEVVYYPGSDATDFPRKGECYQVEQNANGDYFWKLVEFPALLQQFVTLTASHDLQRFYGKKPDGLEERGYAMLIQEQRKAGLIGGTRVRM